MVRADEKLTAFLELDSAIRGFSPVSRTHALLSDTAQAQKRTTKVLWTYNAIPSIIKTDLNQAEEFPPLGSLPPPDLQSQNQHGGGNRKELSMNPLIQLKKAAPLFYLSARFSLILLAGSALTLALFGSGVAVAQARKGAETIETSQNLSAAPLPGGSYSGDGPLGPRVEDLESGGRFQRRFQARLCALQRLHGPNGDLVHEQQHFCRRRLWPDSSAYLRAFYTGGV